MFKLASGTVYYTGVAVKWTYGALVTLVTEPAVARRKTGELWEDIKHEVHHYWLGAKLFVAELRTSISLVTRIGSGEQLTRRERLQLRRTLGDLFRIVPFIIILIIPFAELALPVLLKLFPNMLPSQFVKAEYRQEQYRKALNAKLELHGILQEVLQDRIRAAASAGEKGAPSAEQLLSQLKAVRSGEPLSGDALLSVASLFKDEITLDNMERGQLAVLAKYMGLSPFTPEPVLRYQLRSALRAIKEDDADLAQEGTASLTPDELRSACEMRGMRAADLPEWALRSQLNEWLDLRVGKGVPATIMMLSRGFQIASIMASGGAAPPQPAVKAIQEAMSSLDERTVTEVVLASAAPSAPDAAGADREAARELIEMRLDSLDYQNELIAAEREALAEREAFERAAADAKTAAKAAEAAKTDPALPPSEVAALVQAADDAAKVAAARQESAAAKEARVVKMKAADAARAAGSSKAPTASSAAGPGDGEAAAASESVPPTAEEERDALRKLAAGATVARERALLGKIKRLAAQMETQAAASKGHAEAAAVAAAASAAQAAAAATAKATASPGDKAAADNAAAADAAAAQASAAAAAPAREDRGTAFLKRKLDAMMADLEEDLETVKRCVD